LEETQLLNDPTLGVVTISRNEEQDMPHFLEHLLPWIDEVIIVDDGSTDDTTHIVRAAGPKVKLIEHPKDEEGGFAGQRNVGLKVATPDWVLHMDVDMRVTPELAEEIKHAIQDPTKNAYRFRLLNFFLHRPMRSGGWQNWNKPWLARRGRHRFGNRVHEVCIIDGAPESVGQLEAKMWHLNDEDYVERMRKNLTYAPVVGERFVQRGIKVRWYHMLLHPLWRGFRAYFLLGAFREGTRGLLFALYTCMSTFNWWACAWDQQNRISRQYLENKIIERWNAFEGVPHTVSHYEM
jgi:glycosyltransferase involved in cell wall biosynthesis